MVASTIVFQNGIWVDTSAITTDATQIEHGLMPAVDKVKLDGIAVAATANSTDAFLLARENHTGTESWSVITDTPTTIAGYGITDAAILSGGKIAESQIPAIAWGTVTGTPTTIGGYGITDAATLVNGKVPSAQLPDSTLYNAETVASQAAMLALNAKVGDVVIRTDTTPTTVFILTALPASAIGNWSEESALVQSVNGQIGTVVLAASDVGADPAGSATAAVANHQASYGNGEHIPAAGITDANVDSTAAIEWSKISKSGAVPADIGAQPTASPVFTGSVGIGSNKISFGSAIPTTGTAAQGDFCFNTGAAAGGNFGWVCTVAGTPGTWMVAGIIDSSANNIVVNSGFENGDLTGWSTGNGISVVRDPHTGVFAAQADSTNGDSLSTQSFENLDPNKTYTLTGWIKIISSTNQYLSAWISAGSSRTGITTTDHNIGQWYQVSMSYTPGSTNGQIGIYSQGSGMVAVYDDIQMY